MNWSFACCSFDPCSPESSTHSLPPALFSLVAAYVWFACNFDFLSFCGWTRETGTGADWLIQTNGAPSVHRGPTLDHTGRRCVFLLPPAVLQRCFGVALHVTTAVKSMLLGIHNSVFLFLKKWGKKRCNKKFMLQMTYSYSEEQTRWTWAYSQPGGSQSDQRWRQIILKWIRIESAVINTEDTQVTLIQRGLVAMVNKGNDGHDRYDMSMFNRKNPRQDLNQRHPQIIIRHLPELSNQRSDFLTVCCLSSVRWLIRTRPL